MDTSSHAYETYPARTIAIQRGVIAALAGMLGVFAGLGLGGGNGAADTQREHTGAPATAAAPRYIAGGNRVYRIQDTGESEYLIVDFAHGSVAGIPGWASLRIDTSLRRDRMGNMIRANGN